MSADGSELLGYVKRIAEATERIADHLTKQAMQPVDEEMERPIRKYLTQEHKEPTDGHTAQTVPIRRPRQSSRS